MIIHKCDRKGCTITYEQNRGESALLPPNWFALLFGKYSTQAVYEICPDCRKALGIPRVAPEKDVSQRLLEIIEDLVTDAIENADLPVP